ncbi:hypothetical protein EBU24_00085 [bacterium]|nr:hypothetical protein [bacterium]
MNDNSLEISIISKLVAQQTTLLDALSDCSSLKKDIIKQANKMLKAITIQNGGTLILDKDFLDSAEDTEIELKIEQNEDGSIELNIKGEQEENEE